jgi:hypothetical protein
MHLVPVYSTPATSRVRLTRDLIEHSCSGGNIRFGPLILSHLLSGMFTFAGTLRITAGASSPILITLARLSPHGHFLSSYCIAKFSSISQLFNISVVTSMPL